MIRCMIVDDEPLASKLIATYIKPVHNLELLKICYSGIDATNYLNEHEIDLIFLDINMPKLKGFEFLKTLSSQPKVIVTTAYKEFALEGYELSISDYLLKPFGFERFLKAINKTVSATNKTTQSTVDKNDAVSKSIFLRSNNKYIQITIDTVQYIEAAGNYTKVVTNNETITIREKFSDVLELLNDIDFIQVHKSFAVSKKHIKSIEGNRIFISENIIPIGKTYKANIIQLLK
jgi:DNA-binding LytR/AlgR family response regulator